MAQKQKKKVDHAAQRVIIKKVLRYLGRAIVFSSGFRLHLPL